VILMIQKISVTSRTLLRPSSPVLRKSFSA
jgi:hypothetical protein